MCQGLQWRWLNLNQLHLSLQHSAIISNKEFVKINYIGRFIPSCEMEKMLIDEDRWKWADTFPCFKAYNCKSLQTTTRAVTDYEVDHKRVLIEKILTFGPCKYFVILDCERGCVAPSGNIDLVSCENDQDDTTNLVAVHTCASSSPQDRSNVLSTSAKRESQGCQPQSSRNLEISGTYS